MRSITSSHRRLHSRPPRNELIDATAQLVDERTLDEPGHVLVHVIEEPEDLVLGLKPLEVGLHPFGELAGFSAPPAWSMVGLRVRGTAHHLDGDRRAERTSTTYLLHRSGEERSLLRTDHTVTPLAGRAEGTLPDLCRRVLGLPTDPPPGTTALLWTVAWLDRILEAWGDPDRRSNLCASWSQLACLHPAVVGAAGPDPSQLVALGRAHTEAWPWARLRAAPHALHLPDGHLPPDITGWMDDGFYARWALGAFPTPATLARDVCHLVDDHVGERLAVAVEGLLA